MDYADRHRITSNIKDLIRFTRYSELMDLCLQEHILFPVMREEIEVNSLARNSSFINYDNKWTLTDIVK